MRVPDPHEAASRVGRHGDDVLAAVLSGLLLLQVATDDYLTAPLPGLTITALVATGVLRRPQTHTRR